MTSLRTLTAALVAVLAVLATAAPAGARTDTPAPPTTTVSSATVNAGDPVVTVPGNDTAKDDADTTTTTVAPSRYSSLAAAMVGFYAQSTGSSVDGFVGRNGEAISTFTGEPLGALSGVATATDIDDRLSHNDLFSRIAGERSLPGLTMDEMVVASGAQMTQRMSEMRLAGSGFSTAQGGPQLDVAAATQVPTEALAFGLLLNGSLTSMVSNSPDLFAQVRSTGTGNPQAAAAWRSSMASAGAASTGNLSSRLPDPCGATLISTMATGAAAPASRDCSPCVATGLYLHNQMSDLFATNGGPNSASLAGTTPPANFSALPDWQRNIVTNQNPGLRDSLSASMRNTSSCSSGNDATKATLGSTLPGVFGQLRPR